MFKKTIIMTFALSMFIALPAFAEEGDGDASKACKAKEVAGSYTRVRAFTWTNSYGDPLDRTVVRQLNLHSDGIAHQDQVDGMDVALNFGFRTEWNGSWACQKDGSLVVTMMVGRLSPIPSDAVFPGSYNDLELLENRKTTYRFSVDDKDTLTLMEAVSRRYSMTEDPSDPAAGTLVGPTVGISITYNRLKASDADLLP